MRQLVAEKVELRRSGEQLRSKVSKERLGQISCVYLGSGSILRLVEDTNC